MYLISLLLSMLTQNIHTHNKTLILKGAECVYGLTSNQSYSNRVTTGVSDAHILNSGAAHCLPVNSGAHCSNMWTYFDKIGSQVLQDGCGKEGNRKEIVNDINHALHTYTLLHT